LGDTTPAPKIGLKDDGTFVANADVDGGEEEMADKLLAWARQEEQDFGDSDDEEEWSSKIDEIDPIIYFCEVFHGTLAFCPNILNRRANFTFVVAFHQREAANAQQLMQSLPQETRTALDTLSQTGLRRKERRTLKAQQKAAAAAAGAMPTFGM